MILRFHRNLPFCRTALFLSAVKIIIARCFGADVNPTALGTGPTGIITSWSSGAITALIMSCFTLTGLIVLGAVVYRLSKGSVSSSAQKVEEGSFRVQLAMRLTTGALIFLSVISTLILICAAIFAQMPKENRDASALFFENAKYVLASLLPVIAAWVGTVIAFYFGKENFDAASKSVREMATAVMTSQDRLATTLVTQVGRPIEDAVTFSLAPNAAPTTMLDVVGAAFTKGGVTYERLPILYSTKLPCCVIHRATLNEFLLRNPGKTLANLTLQQLFDAIPWLQKSSYAVVGPKATAAQAKTAMENLEKCADVFVTQDGGRDSLVTRWITDKHLLEGGQI
jgi:hypothetical protein